MSMRGAKPKESAAHKAFKEDLDPAAIAYFNEVAQRPFADQAVAFLNAYWEEIGDQAPFIFEVAWPTIRYAEMHTLGINYIHLYEEGYELDFNVALYFYEKLVQKVFDLDEGRPWRSDPQWAPSLPEHMTAIVRKQELRDKVDVNFDGKMSFLEYLLYQYRSLTSPAEFITRTMAADANEPPQVTRAREALEVVNVAIREFEAEKARLTELSKAPGVKGLGAKHQLAGLMSSPIAEELQVALIKAEAAVRLAVRQAKAEMAADANGAAAGQQGSMFWMQADLKLKQKLYGTRAK
ncbi:Calcium-regulated actin-bundling protein [Hondaea fermentalgiana]|uniref:Calcium-regulated actin-bundling protein n=1 Tax=Hondaea fermentalgiana TaxID=2315210 RepID=A0A2R5FZ08_9STRA|nr:Calcium-regulated actin-bundling protein [Hondaea fermentalgiana]|eukprot:GBG23987.1 Calcium-regulated actin-bundling protein [Hondaea fermentalgiana]